MSKILRIYQGGNDTYQDWNESSQFPYNSTARDTIEDPDGATAKYEITSIPSPFARIDLIKNAFKEVCKPDKASARINLDGTSIFHKMVSDTLDVAEIFFNIDKYKNEVEIITWEPGTMISQMLNSTSEGHRILADSLQKFMISDGSTYNFNKLNNIYLLNYRTGPDQLNIIGATSPATLFFSNADDLSYVKNIYFGQDRPFDGEYQPLYKRDFAFIKYLWTLRLNIPNFPALFPEVDNYLNETYKALTDQQKKNELSGLTPNALQNYDPIVVGSIPQAYNVEVLGHLLHKKVNRPVDTQSDFAIKTSKTSGILPLVLPIEAGNRYSDLVYTTGKWGNTNRANPVDPQPDLSKRQLPFDGSVFPYLTIGDLLEDTLIKTPYTLNSDNYFAGKIELRPQLSYLIPVKPLFFKYFSQQELMGEMPDGKPMFKMTLLAGDSVEVTLRIPVKGNGNINYIEYTRIYYNNSSCDASTNMGNIREVRFNGLIMPQIRFITPTEAIFNISCVYDSSSTVYFAFYSDDRLLNHISQSCRSENELRRADNYLIKGQNFDYIQVCSHTYRGLVLPLFKKQQNTSSFEFAIDLGTSNTHIEYRNNSGQPQPFGFTKADRQACTIFTPHYNEYGYQTDLIEDTEIFFKDFLPDDIGIGDFKFPTRTILSSAKNIDWNNIVDPYTQANLLLTYDKRPDQKYNDSIYDIKWGNTKKQNAMKAYVRNLMLMIRNKVLLNNGNLANTKVIWFYPVSMPPSRLALLRQIWDDAYNEYFGQGNTICMTESFAPIQYLFQRYATTTNLVNIDIGGGTTDIAFATDKKISHITSFRFASNAIFENALADSDLSNGIVDFYKDSFKRIVEEKNVEGLSDVFNSQNNEHPSNMASFLFGLKDLSVIKEKKIAPDAIDFNLKLQKDENFKIIFLVFYTSIIYHIVQITKSLNLVVPRHISFSGNGSKVIRIITPDVNLLTAYTKLIFEKVLGKPYGKELELLGLERDSNPKNSTCKGGIVCGNQVPADMGQNIVFKSDGSGFVTNLDTYSSIDDSYKKRSVEAVMDFFRLMFEDLKRDFNFDKNFGIKSSAINIAREAAKKDLETFLNKGIAKRLEENQPDDTVEETFFFYPVKGSLQAMSDAILKAINNSQL